MDKEQSLRRSLRKRNRFGGRKAKQQDLGRSMSNGDDMKNALLSQDFGIDAQNSYLVKDYKPPQFGGNRGSNVDSMKFR